MKKQIVLLFLMFFTFLFSMPNNTCKASEIENTITSDRVTYSAGLNVLDVNDFEVTDKTLVTKHAMFIAGSYQDKVTIRFRDEYYNQLLKYKLHFYDLDGYFIETKSGERDATQCENELYSDGIAYCAQVFSYPKGTFSVILEVTYRNADFIPNEYGYLKLIKGPTFDPHDENDCIDPLIYQSAGSRFTDTKDKKVTINVIYPNVLSEESIRNMFKAYDGTNTGDYYGIALDFDYDAYLNVSEVVGKHPMFFEASDDYGNKTTLDAIVNVIDNEKPYLTGPDSIRHPINTTLTEEFIKSKYNASDNYDGDISNKIEINPDYTKNSSTVMNETIFVSVEDNSGNQTIKSVNVEFYDNVKPVIDCPDTITVSYRVNLPLIDIVRNSLRVTDNIDTDVTVTIYTFDWSVNIYESTRKIGDYQIEIKATDDENNTATKSVIVKVEDKIPPVIFVDNYRIELTDGVTITLEDITNLLYSNGVLENGKHYKARIVSDTYSNHKDIDGTYHMVVEYTNDSDTISKEFTVRVKSNLYTVDVYSPAINKATIIIIILSSVLVVFATIIAILTIRNKRRNKESNGEL
ncbi:MAG: hypothetical protein K6F59_05175 [Gammaproteobacteria bacterium]|nr:hypothetical protein [Gammaproteobacteria bacterium]